MKPFFLFQEHIRTTHIHLDTRKCKACWHCLTCCPAGVIGKIDLPWHKHALMINPSLCSGCLMCVASCVNGAFTVNDRAEQQPPARQLAMLRHFIVNNLVLLAGLLAVLSGLILQLGFHMGGSAEGIRGEDQPQQVVYEQIRALDSGKMIWGMNYYDWSVVHKVAIVVFSLLMIYHVYTHWKWYKGVLTRHLFRKNAGVLILTLLFLLVAVTGFVPWVIDLLTAGKGIERMVFIEIHDKLTLLLIVFMVLHVVGRWRWFATAFRKWKER
ncbi:MAG: hypothetical protein CVU06_00700 [Bacteroidetes bacterium HGW-Bacteroidetes-22]|nr:MAG: hypothetical protein CVU06_00700 [Bacteroidetes bacterium HGW-Bacteroidetes-22]